MDIETTYQKIISEINLGHRALTKISPDDLDELNQEMISSLEQNNFKKLEQILCIIEHSASFHNKFENNLIRILNSEIPPLLVVFALNCSRKHIVEARFQRGHRLEFPFLESLNKLLFHKEPEVVEWTLRLIEGAGNQGIYFLKDFDKIKPAPWKWFNSHQRAVREIITLLERRWSPVEKSKR